MFNLKTCNSLILKGAADKDCPVHMPPSNTPCTALVLPADATVAALAAVAPASTYPRLRFPCVSSRCKDAHTQHGSSMALSKYHNQSSAALRNSNGQAQRQIAPGVPLGAAATIGQSGCACMLLLLLPLPSKQQQRPSAGCRLTWSP